MQSGVRDRIERPAELSDQDELGLTNRKER
jgi:hypothetical protein